MKTSEEISQLDQFCKDASNGVIEYSYYNSHINSWREANETLCFIDIFPKSNNSEKIVRSEVLHDPNFIEYASEHLRNNENIVEIAVSVNGLTLEFASERLQDNENIVRTAVNENDLALQFASERLQSQRDNISKLFACSLKNEDFFLRLNNRIKSKMKPFIHLIIQKWIHLYENLPIDLRQDERIAVAAVTITWQNFEYVPKELKANQSIINALIQGNLRCRNYLLSELEPIIMVKVLFFEKLTEEEKNKFIKFIKQNPDFLEAVNNNIQMLIRAYFFSLGKPKFISRFNWQSFKAIAGKATMKDFRAFNNREELLYIPEDKKSSLMTICANIIQQNKAEIECRIESFSSYAEACTAAVSAANDNAADCSTKIVALTGASAAAKVFSETKADTIHNPNSGETKNLAHSAAGNPHSTFSSISNPEEDEIEIEILNVIQNFYIKKGVTVKKAICKAFEDLRMIKDDVINIEKQMPPPKT